ncbi:hypothetical protein ACJIZ3_006795 [Penstemon smallii]|uniref:X8 domain-containing protein n=1 Tax=Penstemon smallii TaxID=265156 RepID=A0ABD3S8P8_9LAMI
MEKNRARVVPLRLCSLGLCLCFVAICLVHSADATKIIHKYISRKHLISNSNTIPPRIIHKLTNFDMNMPLDLSNSDPYVSSPFSLPPYEALPPFPLSENTPPFCSNPPSTPQPPSTIPSPVVGYTPNPPPSSSVPTLPSPGPESPIFSPPENTPNPNLPTINPSPESPILSPPENTPNPNPPTVNPSPESPIYSPPENTPNPNPPTIVLSPPTSYEPSPPSFEPSPPYNVPSPSGFVPSPRFLPPVVFPPPTVPPPPHRAPSTAMWCVAKASVPDPIIQEAMNYACGSGADCNQIQPSGSCFEPNTLFAHASYAFNSYYQRTKVGGGTCDFGGTAILVTVDPSYDGCQFIYF